MDSFDSINDMSTYLPSGQSEVHDPATGLPLDQFTPDIPPGTTVPCPCETFLLSHDIRISMTSSHERIKSANCGSTECCDGLEYR